MAKPSARPVRRQDIHFKRSLFRFTITFLVVSVLGLFTRVFLHNYPLKDKIVEQVQVPEKLELKVDQVSFAFQSGWVPVLGVAINRVDLLDKACALRKVSGQDLLLRLNPWSLFAGKLKIGEVDIDYLEVTAAQNCQEVVGAEEDGNPLESSQTQEVAVETSKRSLKKNVESWSKEIDQVFNQVARLKAESPLEQIHIKNLQMDWQGKKTSIHLEARVDLDLDREVKANIQFGKVRYGEKDLSFLRSKWKLLVNPEQIDLRMETSVREGEWLSQVRVENSENYPAYVTGTLRRIPLSAVMSLFVGDLGFSYLWANCDFETKGPLAKIQQQKIQLGNCLIDGPYGEIDVNEFDATFEKLKQAKITLKNLQLGQVLENKRDLYFSGVFSDYGNLSAELVFAEGEWFGEGFLEKSEFIFSKNNLRDIQKVKKIPFEFSKKADQLKARVANLELDDGRFEGELNLQQTQKGKTSGRIAIHKIQLNPRIYKLILNSEPAELRVYGKFNWSEEEKLQWSAMLATEELKSEFYDLKFLKVKGSSEAAGEARLRVTISEGSIQPKGPFLQWIEPTDLDQKLSSDSVEFTELSTLLTLHDSRDLSWSRGYVRLKNGWQLSSEGERDSQKQVKAWLQWDRPDKKYLRWNYSGTFFEGRWVPETDWVKQWLNAHPEFLKDFESVSFTASKVPLSEKIGKASKKAIEKVKEALQPQNKEDKK